MPDEIVSHIIDFLPFKDQLRCEAVCKRWMRIVQEGLKHIALEGAVNRQRPLTHKELSPFCRFRNVRSLTLRYLPEMDHEAFNILTENMNALQSIDVFNINNISTDMFCRFTNLKTLSIGMVPRDSDLYMGHLPTSLVDLTFFGVDLGLRLIYDDEEENLVLRSSLTRLQSLVVRFIS